MERAQCARSERVKIDRWMPAFAGNRHTMKLLLRIASPGIENSQAKIARTLRCHCQMSPRITRMRANKSKRKVAKICFDFDLLRFRDPLVFKLWVVTEIHEEAKLKASCVQVIQQLCTVLVG